MAAVSDPKTGQVVLFGGQNSETGVMYNEMFTINTREGFKVTQHQYADGKIAPAPRNAHTITRGDSDLAYLFGGANEEGPRNDLFKLDLEKLEFSNIKVQGNPKVKLPMVEMHTAHLYQEGKKLLVLGGRGMTSGQTLDEIDFQN